MSALLLGGASATAVGGLLLYNGIQYEHMATLVAELVEQTVSEAVRTALDGKSNTLVAVRGLVGSDSPLRPPGVGQCVAYLSELVQIVVSGNRLLPHHKEEVISRTWEVVPFFLRDRAGGGWLASSSSSQSLLHVHGRFSVGELPLQLVAEEFSEAKQPSWLEMMFSTQWTQGFRLQTKALAVDTDLIAVGLLRVGSGRSVSIVGANGFPVLLQRGSVNNVATSLRSTAFGYRIAGGIFLLIGATCILFKLWSLYREYEMQRQTDLFMQEYENDNEEDEDGPSGEGGSSRRNLKCLICFGPRNALLLECGHFCVCLRCSQQVATCPVCRQHITRRVKAYVS